jgi:hypothetical protein
LQNSKKIIDPQKINDARLEKKVFIGLDKENEGKFYIILYYIILYYIILYYIILYYIILKKELF